MARGEVKYRLFADNKEFRKAFSEAESQVEKLGTAMAKFGAAGVAGAVAAVGALGLAMGKALDQADKFSNLAAKTGLTAESLQKLGAVGLTTGTSIETLSASVNKMQKILVESPKAFDRMGLSAKQLIAMKPEDAFARIAEKIGSIENPAQRTAAAMAAFGRGGAELLPLLSTNIAEVSARAEQLGLVMSNELVAALDEVGDQLDLTKAAGGALITNFGAMLATTPGVKEAISGLGDIFGRLSASILANKAGIQEWTKGGLVFLVNGLVSLVDAVQLGLDVWSSLRLAWISTTSLTYDLGIAFNYAAKAADFLMTVGGSKLQSYFNENITLLKGAKAAAVDEAAAVVKGNTDKANAIQAVRLEIVKLGKAIETSKAGGLAGAGGMGGGGSYSGAASAAEAAKIDKLIYDSKIRARDEFLARELADVDRHNKEMQKSQFDLYKEDISAAKDRFERRRDYEQQFFDISQRLAEDQHRANIQATQDFGDLGNAIAGLGDALGSGFLSNIGQAVDLFSQISVQAQNATTGMQKATVAIGAISSSASGGSVLGGIGKGAAAGAMFGPYGAAIGAVVGGLAGLAGKLGIFGNKAVMETNKARDAFFKAEGGFEAFSKKMAKVSSEDWAKKIFDAKTVDEFNRLVGEAQSLLALQGESQEALNAAVEKYGFTIEELGPKFAQQKLDEQAGQLLQDYKLLTAAGVDHTAILAKMGPSFNEYVNASIAAGTAIPEAMRPVIQSLIDSGQLLDANGEAFTSVEDAGITFAQTMSEQFSTLIEKIDRMVSALLGIPTDINTNVNINTNHTSSGGGGGGQQPDGMARGGVILPFRKAAGGTVAAATPGGVPIIAGEGGQTEIVAPVAALAREIGRGLRGDDGGGGGNTKPVYLVLDRQVIGTVVVDLNKSGRIPIKTGSLRRGAAG